MVPSKLFGILAAGRPALFIGSPKSEISQVIVENGCGVTVRQGDSDLLITAIRRYVENPSEREAAGERARSALIEQHSMEQRCKTWLSLLEEVTA